MTDSLWFTTRSALFRPGDDAWNEVALYADPLRRLLERRYRWLDSNERDDLVQDLLVEMKQALVARHDRARAPFRALLQTVVQRRVADRLRARRAASLGSELEGELTAPRDDEIVALDLEARLLDAVQACRDRFTQGPARDHDVLFALVDRIVHGRSGVEIARASGWSEDRVARLLERGRDAIFEHLLARELALAPEDPQLARALGAFKEALRRPRETARILERLERPELAAPLEELLGGVFAAFRQLAGEATATGDELRRGFELILGVESA